MTYNLRTHSSLVFNEVTSKHWKMSKKVFPFRLLSLNLSSLGARNEDHVLFCRKEMSPLWLLRSALFFAILWPFGLARGLACSLCGLIVTGRTKRRKRKISFAGKKRNSQSESFQNSGRSLMFDSTFEKSSVLRHFGEIAFCECPHFCDIGNGGAKWGRS